MLRSRSFLGLTLAAALLAGCSDMTPLAPAGESEPLLANGASQGLIRVTFPSAESPGVPAYARIESGQVYISDGWAVIAFYRDPTCVHPDFDLLNFFDVPAAFGCPLTVEGFALYEPDAYRWVRRRSPSGRRRLPGRSRPARSQGRAAAPARSSRGPVPSGRAARSPVNIAARMSTSPSRR
jgi:hypothetical protein